MKRFILLLFLPTLSISLNLSLVDYHDPIANHILDAEVIDNTLIISAMVQGIEFYDISDPASLDHLSHFTLGAGVRSNCVTASGNYAYFTSSNGVYVVNISNPSNPTNYGNISGTSGLILENLDLFGNTLAVCAHADGVKLYDVSNPSNPSYLSTILTNNAWAVVLSDDIAYVADESNVRVVDISNIASPVVVTTIQTGNAVKDVAVDGNYLYVALGSDGVDIYDISNPTFPQLLGNYDTPTLANRISPFESKLAVSDWDDVQVLEWTGSELELVGYKNTSRRPMAIATKGDFIYSAEWASVQAIEFGIIEGPDVDLSSTYLIWPFVEEGNSYSMFIDVINNGNETWVVSENYTTNSEFTVENPLSALEAGESQTVELVYTASEENASGFYRIYSNDPDESEIVSQLVGNVDGANVGQAAPDFELEYVANGEGYFQLSDHLGQIVVIAFFSPG